MFSIVVMQTKVISCNSANKSCLLQVVHTKAIAALTQFCDFLVWGLLIQTNKFCFLSFSLFLLYHVVLVCVGGGVPSDYFVSTQLQLWLFCCWGCGCCWPVAICRFLGQIKKLAKTMQKIKDHSSQGYLDEKYRLILSAKCCSKLLNICHTDFNQWLV